MRYFIAHLPKGPIEEYHRALVQYLAMRFGLEIRAGYFPTHITLKAPFEATLEQIDSLKNFLFSFSQLFNESNRPTPFIVNGFEYFGKAVIALKIEPSARMDLLTTTLVELFKAFSWITWGPYESSNSLHITVAKKGLSEKFDCIWKHLEQKEVPLFELSFNNVALLRFENNTWVVDSIYPLNH